MFYLVCGIVFVTAVTAGVNYGLSTLTMATDAAIVGAISKSVHEERITKNFDVFDFELILFVILTYTVVGRFGAMERSAG